MMSVTNEKIRIGRIFKLVIAAFLSQGAIAAEKPILNDWFALGSGCKASFTQPGNVSIEKLPSSGDTYKVRFLLPQYTLQGDTADASVVQFARECAIRLNINPPPGKNIKIVRAATKIQIAKDTGASLKVLSELKIGASSLGLDEKKYESNERKMLSTETVLIGTADGISQLDPKIKCAEPKIIGFDFSWIAKRDKKEITSLSVALDGQKSLEIEAVLEDCEG